MSFHSSVALLSCFLFITGTTGLHRHAVRGVASPTCICQNGTETAHASRFNALPSEQQTLAETASALPSKPHIHMSEEQLMAELQSAKKQVATMEGLLDLKFSFVHYKEEQLMAELQLAKKHVVNLEGLQAKSKKKSSARAKRKRTEAKQSPEPSSSESSHTTYQRITKLVSLFLFISCMTLWALWNIRQYEHAHVEWYHNNACVTKVLLAAACDWLAFGVWWFTEFFYFTDDGRFLTVIEAVYLNSQIITSVGYGDFTPTTENGTIFMTFYALIAVALFMTLTQHMIMWYIEMAGDGNHQHDLAKVLAPVIACGVFGTLFYSYYPGEDLTLWQGLNLSVITFLSVGFGDISPQTTVGQLVASIWMVLGVICLGKAIVDGTKTLFQHRKNLHSQAAASRAFDELDRNHKGYIEKWQFLGFELVQEGLEQSTIDTIMAKFDQFDLEHNGVLDFKEFKAYVDSVDE